MRDDTIRAIDAFQISILGNKKNIEKAEEMLTNDESVLFVTPSNVKISNSNTGKVDDFPGVVFLTNKRVVFHYKILSKSLVDTVSLDEIRSINCYTTGVMGVYMELHSVTKSYNISLISIGNIGLNEIQAVFENAKRNFVNGSQGVSQSDSLEQIEKLASLRERGIITEDEFQNKKTELLGNVGSQSVRPQQVSLHASQGSVVSDLKNSEEKPKKKNKGCLIALIVFAAFAYWFTYYVVGV